jgi:hypoxanthine phosphoribosyltransferase
MNTLHLSWEQIQDAVARLDDALRRQGTALENRPRLVYGVPRGGSIVAALLTAHGWQPVETPQEATVIVDDLVDSGRTLTPYVEQGFPAAVLFAKAPAPRGLVARLAVPPVQLGDAWVHFPWDHTGAPDDAALRLLQYAGLTPPDGDLGPWVEAFVAVARVIAANQASSS